VRVRVSNTNKEDDGYALIPGRERGGTSWNEDWRKYVIATHRNFTCADSFHIQVITVPEKIACSSSYPRVHPRPHHSLRANNQGRILLRITCTPQVSAVSAIMSSFRNGNLGTELIPSPMASSSSNFQSIFNSALETYEKTTKNKLLTHPLATQLQSCDSPASFSPYFRTLSNNSTKVTVAVRD
jgi:hypothetical protein